MDLVTLDTTTNQLQVTIQTDGLLNQVTMLMVQELLEEKHKEKLLYNK